MPSQLYVTDEHKIETIGGSFLPGALLEKLKTVDGPGSGLDADTWHNRSVLELDQAKQGIVQVINDTTNSKPSWLPLTPEIMVDNQSYTRLFAIQWFGGSLDDVSSFVSGVVHYICIGTPPVSSSGFVDYNTTAAFTRATRLRFGLTISSGNSIPNVGDTIRFWMTSANGYINISYRNIYPADDSFWQATTQGSASGVSTQPANFTLFGETRV